MVRQGLGGEKEAVVIIQINFSKVFRVESKGKQQKPSEVWST